MRVRYTPRARDDLEAILDYLAQHSPRGSANVGRSIRKTIELIGDFPEGGRVASELDARVLPAGRHPYVVYWTVEGGRSLDSSHSRRSAPTVEGRVN